MHIYTTVSSKTNISTTLAKTTKKDQVDNVCLENNSISAEMMQSSLNCTFWTVYLRALQIFRVKLNKYAHLDSYTSICFKHFVSNIVKGTQAVKLMFTYLNQIVIYDIQYFPNFKTSNIHNFQGIGSIISSFDSNEF